MTTHDLRRIDKQHLWHPFTPMSLWLDSNPLVISGGDGFHLIDSDGNRYLDGVSSLWCNVHGHRVPQIDQAIRNQLDKIAHSTLLGLAGQASIELADQLMPIVPPNLTKLFFSDAGATATEITFKLAVQYWFNLGQPQKNQFIAFGEAYHGDTIGAISVGRMPSFHRPYLPLLFNVHFAPTPYVYRWPGGNASEQQVRDACLIRLEEILQQHPDQIAAICIEPIVQGAGGMIIQPDGFLAGVRALATKYNTLLICDEVATGFARTGRMFAVEHENVRPDLMTLAKGITGGYLPLAVTLATQAIFDAFLGHPSQGKTFFHGHTYTGNPLACAAAIANLELMHQSDTVGNVARNAPLLGQMLDRLRTLPHVGDIRQKGYMVGIELVADKSTRRPLDPSLRTGHAICQNIRSRGVILRPLGDTLVLMPPPAMGLSDLEQIVEAVDAELRQLSVQS